MDACSGKCSPDNKSRTIKSKVPLTDDYRRGFKWSFNKNRKNNSKESRQKHGPQNRSHPYTSSMNEDKKPAPLKQAWEFLPSRQSVVPNTTISKNEEQKLADYKLKNPTPSSKQILQLERDAIEMRNKRRVDFSRGLITLKHATTINHHEDMTPRDADDDQYHRRLVDRSKLKSKNYSAAFMKAFFDEANAIAERLSSDKTNEKHRKNKSTKERREKSGDANENTVTSG